MKNKNRNEKEGRYKIQETKKSQKMITLKGGRNIKNYIRFLLFLSLFITELSQAKNLGVWGAMFPIAEQDIKEFIYKRLNQMQQNGELEKIKKKFIRNVKNHTLRPAPVSGLTTTDRPKTFYYDPIYILDKNIEDEKGKIIAKAGTTINPLDTIKLHSVLFFLNADDKRQIAWALENVKKHDYVKYILVQGNIKDAGKVLSDRIYFDQHGIITRKLGVMHIPCVVKQEGKKLQVQEISLKKETNENKEIKTK
ncbi:MAG: type-F conjugative transfer system protein TraW [Gammaproteobacteria bacterium]|nr:type-F conjugative transfer system protein TraW [Gammaproteobacteria bacterium]